MLRPRSTLCWVDGRLAALRYTSGAAQQIEAFNFFASNLGYNVFGAPIEYANYLGGKPKNILDRQVQSEQGCVL